MAERPIQVSFEDEIVYFHYNATLDEIASSLSGGDPSEKRLIRFSTLMNSQLVGIGDDVLLRSLRDSSQGEFRLIAKVRGKGDRSSRSQSSRSKVPSEYSMIDDQRSDWDSQSIGQRSTEASVSCALRYRVGYSGVLCDDNFIRLKKPLGEMSLFEVGQCIVEAQGLSPLSFSCYLYNKCGWPLAVNIEQTQLISADSYLVNGDFVFGIIWEERPPKPIAYVDPDYGQFEYCFDYHDYTFAIHITPNDRIFDVRMKLLWKLRVPLDSISVITTTVVSMKLEDDYLVKLNDINSKGMKFCFESPGKSFSKVDDLMTAFDAKQIKKLYGYLYVLQKNASQDLHKSLALAACLLGERLQAFLFSFHLLLTSSNLTKAERVALLFGCRIMHKTYISFVTSDQSQDFSLMFGLIHHVASTLSTELAPLLTITECSEVKAQPVAYGVSDDPQKEYYLINALKYSHSTVPLLVVNSSAYSFVEYVAAAGARPPMSFTVLNNYLKEAAYLTILHPRDITNSSKNRLTYHPSGELWVCQGLEDNCHDIGLDQDAILLDILSRERFLLKKRLLIDQVQKYLPAEGSGVVISREPQEAIVVIFDTSGSMSTKYQREDTNTRLDAAKIFFLLFAQKTMAYDYPHVFSLCTFAGTSSFRFDFTENMDSFLELVQGLKPGGNTALYSAMEQGIAKLQTIKNKYPQVALRMMIISDGEDNDSKVTAKFISDKVNEHGITVDVFAVGGNCALVKMISKRSGGYCYYTDTIIDGVRTFESETILKLSLRKPAPYLNTRIDSEGAFNAMAEIIPFDTEPPLMLALVDMDSKVCSSFRAFELQVANQANNPLVAKRVLRELAKYNRDPHPDFALFPLSKNLFVWRGLVEGPPSTPYAGGIFDFYMSFGEGYPGKAPEMRFITPISHPNITQNGKICHPIFNTSYTTETSVRDILNNVFSLLMTQDFDDYVVSNLSITLSFNKEQFRAKATDWTQRYARRTKSKEQLIKEMMIEDDTPEKYKCALSKCLMRNPVFSPKSDKIFERSVIENHINKFGVDPVSRLPLRIDELIPDFRLQREINSLYPA